MFNIWLSIKFRAFGITFVTIEQAWSLSYDGTNITFEPVAWSAPPADAKTLVDEHGILLAVQAAL